VGTPKAHFPEINEEIQRKAIWDSGYLLERRVAALLRDSGYKVITNRGFFDPELNKSREYDVYAHKSVKLFGEGSHEIYPTLICECKNNKLPIAFFVHDEEDFEPLINEVMVSGIPSKIWLNNKCVSIQEFSEVLILHHYCKPISSVASQCCTFSYESKNKFWKASHEEELHDTERILTKALENEIENDYKNMSQWIISEEKETDFVDLSLYYPLVIYQGEIDAVSFNKNGQQTKDDLIITKCDHIQYNPEFYSFYENEVISYHIDVITEKYLPTYIKNIENEISEIKKVLRQKRQYLKLSVDRLMQECRSLETKPKTYRKYLEYPF